MNRSIAHPAHRGVLALAVLLLATAARAASPGEGAPAFALPDGQGTTVTLDGLRGQVVLVDFWASWCGPCKRSFPWMNELQQKYGAKGLAVVAVNVDKRRPDAERFLAQVPARFTVVFDPAGATPAAYAVAGMPSSYLLDAAGRVVLIEKGFEDDRKAAVEDRIRALLAAR